MNKEIFNNDTMKALLGEAWKDDNKPVKEELHQLSFTGKACNIKDFVKVIVKNFHIFNMYNQKFWFTVQEAVEVAKEAGYFLTDNQAKYFCDRLVSRGYFTKQDIADSTEYARLFLGTLDEKAL